MKRLSLLVLVGILAVGLFSIGDLAGQPDPANASDDTFVEWTIDADFQCTLELDAHNGVNLGTLTEVPHTYLASDTGYGTTVNTSSNCAYEVSVKIDDVTSPLTSSKVLDDFGILAESHSGGIAENVDDIWTGDWWTDKGIDDSIVFGSGGDYADYGTMDDATWTMDYRYVTDYDDDNGYYRVDLLYTASTT